MSYCFSGLQLNMVNSFCPLFTLGSFLKYFFQEPDISFQVQLLKVSHIEIIVHVIIMEIFLQMNFKNEI